MSYCTINDLQRILPEKFLVGDQNIGTPNPGRVGSGRSNISVRDSNYYIDYAQQFIDGKLRPFYSCPLRRIKTVEVELMLDITPGSDAVITVRDTGPFVLGDVISERNLGAGNLVRLQNKKGYEEISIKSITDLQQMVAWNVTGSYDSDNTIVSILEYPDPIPIMTARLACSYLLDKYFAAEQAPGVSEYGKTQRALALGAMDDIMDGQILLFGQEHTGRRFVRGSLHNAWSSPVAELRSGEDKE